MKARHIAIILPCTQILNILSDKTLIFLPIYKKPNPWHLKSMSSCVLKKVHQTPTYLCLALILYTCNNPLWPDSDVFYDTNVFLFYYFWNQYANIHVQFSL